MSGSIKLASSTGSVGQVIGVDAAGNAKWETGAAVDPFPFTGSAQITGSLIITGSASFGNQASRNTINPNALNAFVVGDGNAINGSGEDNVILGGEGNAINGGSYSAILGAASTALVNVDTSVALGGYQNTLQGTRTFILGGNQNTVSSGTVHSGVIGGQFNQVNSSITGSVVIGGKNIGADANDTVFVPALNVGKGSTPGDVIVEAGSVNVTGSIVGSTSILAGQNAAAFSSDAVRLGNATTPVQYGSMIVHANTSGAMLGNQYNGFTIDDPGTSNIQLASTSFSGLGNTVHLLAWGANSVGRADTTKLWSSGSGAELNVSTDLVIQSGNKLTMSGSIELASSTGSVGQVIGVDASGKAKWETAGAATAFPYTGSAQITGSLAVTGSTNISLNQAGTAPTLVIEDKANTSFSVGPTLQFKGSSVGLIKSDTNKNLTIEATQDLKLDVENQFELSKSNSTGDAYQFINNGSLWAKFQNENIRSTGSITFADPTIDVGVALRMDNDKMALQMYSGSAFVPIIQRASGSQQVNLYDSSRSTGSAAQILTSNVNGGIEWAAAGGGITSFSNTTRTSLAGPSAADTMFTQLLIPAGTFTAGDILKFTSLTKQDYTGGGTIYSNLGFSPTSGSGGTNFGSWSSTNQQAAMFDKTICIITADGTGDGTVAKEFGGNIDANNNGFDQFPDGPNGKSVNWNNDVYFFINAFVDNASSLIESRYINIRKLN